MIDLVYEMAIKNGNNIVVESGASIVEKFEKAAGTIV